MLPNFLGLGAPKSATTWLFNCLREHPEVFMADSKEVMFFDYGSIEGRLETYEEHFENAGRAKAIGEFSTRYLASTRAPERVKSLLPEVKLIASLRRPAEQIYSHYWHLRRQNFHGLEVKSRPMSFDEALEQLSEKLLEPAFYYRHLSNWLNVFDRPRIHIILYDDIVADPKEILRNLYAFLGVDSDFTPAALLSNSSKIRRGTIARSPRMELLHRAAYTNLVKRIYTPLKSVLGVKRADRIKSSLRIREIMTALFHETGYPDMAPETIRRLSKRYEADILDLSKLLGRPLNHWLSVPWDAPRVRN